MSNSDTILVGRWNLQDTDKTAKDTEIMLTTAGETALPGDHRTVVSADDIKDGGKYRSVVKLQIQFENQNDTQAWAMATGWLVQPDILVTAGHCAYDWSNQMKRAIKVKAYIGYNGKDSVKTDSVQFRKGIQIATTSGWLSSQQNRESDVSFVKLEKPFDSNNKLNLIKYTGTPRSGSETLGVVGYPADKKKTVNGKDELGAQMYEEYDPVNYNLDKSYKNMLEYPISTYAGNSGSPVLRSKTDSSGSLVSIATHAYGGLRVNSGSPVAGNYGNPYDSYLLAFDSSTAVVKTLDNIDYVSVPYQSRPEFSFGDAFKAISPFGTAAGDILNAAAPFLGPIAGPCAALAGAALAYAGSIAEANMGAEVSLNSVDDYTGFIQRGIIAEASIQVVLGLTTQQYSDLNLDRWLTNSYDIVAPHLYGLGPRLLPVVMQPASSMGYDAYKEFYDAYQNLKNGGTEAQPDPNPKTLNHPDVQEGATDPQTEDFLTKMWKDTVEISGEDPDWFFNQLGQVIYDGILKGQSPTKTAPGGICFLSSLASAKGNGLPLTDTDADLHLLSLRAVVGEAALQAFIQYPHHDKLEEAKVFDNIKKHAQEIGRRAMKTAEWVLPRLVPIVTQLLKGEMPDAGGQTDDARIATANLKQNTGTKAAEIAHIKKRAALCARGLPVGAAGKKTVQEMLIQRLDQTVNLDGLAWSTSCVGRGLGTSWEVARLI